MPEKWACCAAADVPRDKDTGYHHESRRPDLFRVCGMRRRTSGTLRARANDHRNAGFHQLANPFLSVLVLVSNGQSSIEPQYTTARMPISISSRPLATRASKSGEPSGRQGVMRAGVHPLKTCAARVMRFRSSEYSYKSIRVSSPNQRPGMGTPMTASYFSSKRLRALTRTMP